MGNTHVQKVVFYAIQINDDYLLIVHVSNLIIEDVPGVVKAYIICSEDTYFEYSANVHMLQIEWKKLQIKLQFRC